MNFEALSLFQHTTVPSAVEQQQSMGELKDILLNTAEISIIERENRSRLVNTPFTSNTNLSRTTTEQERQQQQQQRDLFDEDTETPRRVQPTPLSSAGPPRAGNSSRSVASVGSRTKPPQSTSFYPQDRTVK